MLIQLIQLMKINANQFLQLKKKATFCIIVIDITTNQESGAFITNICSSEVWELFFLILGLSHVIHSAVAFKRKVFPAFAGL